jgi:hypothetical protein
MSDNVEQPPIEPITPQPSDITPPDSQDTISPATLPKRIGPNGISELSTDQQAKYFEDRLKNLTKTQLRIAGLMSVGMSSQDIAEELHITHDSVRQHIYSGDLYGFRGLTPHARQQLEAARWASIGHRALSKAEERLDEVSPMQLVTVAAIASDKVHRNYVRQDAQQEGDVTEVELRIRKRYTTPRGALPDD